MSARSVYASTLLIVLAAVLFGVGVGTEYWATYDAYIGSTKVGSANSGLWQACVSDTHGQSSCTKIDCDDDSNSGGNGDSSDTLTCADVKAMRAFGVLAVMIAVGAFALQLLIAMDKFPRAYLPALLLTLLASFSGMVVFAIYADKPPHDPVKFGYSFGVEVTASVISFVSAILFWYGARGTSSGYSLF